jgi:hypothetical protein
MATANILGSPMVCLLKANPIIEGQTLTNIIRLGDQWFIKGGKNMVGGPMVYKNFILHLCLSTRLTVLDRVLCPLVEQKSLLMTL